MGERRGAYRVLVRKLEGKTPLGRTRRRRKNILSWTSRKWDGRAWASLVWIWTRTDGKALVKAVLNFQVPKNAEYFLTIREPVSFSRRNLLQGVSKFFSC